MPELSFDEHLYAENCALRKLVETEGEISEELRNLAADNERKFKEQCDIARELRGNHLALEKALGVAIGTIYRIASDDLAKAWAEEQADPKRECRPYHEFIMEWAFFQHDQIILSLKPTKE